MNSKYLSQEGILSKKTLEHYEIKVEENVEYSFCTKPKNAREAMGLLKGFIPESKKSRVIIDYDPDFSEIVIRTIVLGNQ